MKKSLLYKPLICAALLLLAGCADGNRITTKDQICVQATTKTDAMEAAEKVLAEMHFSIEKLDVETGYIRTHPLSGSQSFEFWRCDSIGSFNRTEADLHSIRRIAELNIAEPPGRLCITCKATTQRLSLPQTQANGSEQGYATLLQSHHYEQKLKLSPEQKANASWLNLGTDSQLETEILKRIEKQLAAAKPVLNPAEGKEKAK
jgi:hypothetical protein